MNVHQRIITKEKINYVRDRLDSIRLHRGPYYVLFASRKETEKIKFKV